MTKRDRERGGEGVGEATPKLEVHQAGWEGRERVVKVRREGEVGDRGWQLQDVVVEIAEQLQVSEGGQRRERMAAAFVESEMREGREGRERMREGLAGVEPGEGREVRERMVETPIYHVVKRYQRWCIWKGLLVHASCREVEEEHGGGEDNGLIVVKPKIEACEGGKRRKLLIEAYSRGKMGECWK